MFHHRIIDRLAGAVPQDVDVGHDPNAGALCGLDCQLRKSANLRRRSSDLFQQRSYPEQEDPRVPKVIATRDHRFGHIEIRLFDEAGDRPDACTHLGAHF